MLPQIEKLLPEITGKPEGEDPQGIAACMPDLPVALAKEFGHDGLGEYAPETYTGPIEVLSRGCTYGKCICAKECTRTHPQRDKHRHRHVRTRTHAHMRKQRIHATTRTFIRFLQQHSREKFMCTGSYSYTSTNCSPLSRANIVTNMCMRLHAHGVQ